MVGVDSLLQDRYRIQDKIASGGMGSVYRALDEKLGREVAIKILAPNLAEDSSFVERFRREARAAAGLRHPNIANVFDAGEGDGCHFIVMELAEGRDLARVLREEGPLDHERAIQVLDQICLALGHAHSAGIIHRDVKPANVIVSDAGSVKVTDFGIARAADDSKLTATGSVLGTAHYISPEQAEGKPLSSTSDIYSLGIVMFETLTGALPFTGDSLMAVAMRHINDPMPLPSSIDSKVPPALDRIVERATRKDPSTRYADAFEMHQDLSSALHPGDGATAVLPAAATTAAATTAVEPTVWPIPGDRWDPNSLGRKVLLVFGGLAVIALGLLVWRLAAAEAPEVADPTSRRSQAARGIGPENLTIPREVIGRNALEVEAQFAEAGWASSVETLEGEALLELLNEAGIDPQDAEEGEVVGTDPEIGSTVGEGRTITLFVSSGLPSEDDKDDDAEDPKEPKGKAEGHDKKKEEDD